MLTLDRQPPREIGESPREESREHAIPGAAAPGADGGAGGPDHSGAREPTGERRRVPPSLDLSATLLLTSPATERS